MTMWYGFLWLGFFLWARPVAAQEIPVAMNINQNSDQIKVEIVTSLPDLVTEDSGVRVEKEKKGECKAGVDYDSNGVTNSLDYILCRLGKFFSFLRYEPKITVFYPKKEYKNNYVLILYPRNTVSARSGLELGGQFTEVPNEGNYISMDVYFDSSDNNNMRNKIINLIGDDDESEIKKLEMKMGEYVIELIYQSSGTYYSIRKEINWP